MRALIAIFAFAPSLLGTPAQGRSLLCTGCESNKMVQPVVSLMSGLFLCQGAHLDLTLIKTLYFLFHMLFQVLLPAPYVLLQLCSLMFPASLERL